MGIRHQQKSDKYPFLSPTTPGLYITFRSYIIEFICMNVNKSIGPRFWSDQKYWGPKFRREVKGVDNIIKHFNTTDIMFETAFIYVIKNTNVKCLTYKSTIKKVIKNIQHKMNQLCDQKNVLTNKKHHDNIDMKINSTFIDINDETKLAKVKRIENG